jgi:hypothetical protein
MLPTLVERRWNLVITDLPALNPGATLAAGNAIATSLNALVSDNRVFRQADEIRREQEKSRTPEKCFSRIGVLKLLRLCQVTNSDELPEMWLNLAAEPRRQDGIMAIQQAFNGTAQSLGLFGVHIPITPDIVGKIRSVALEMANAEDLTTGIHPFTFAYLDSSEIAEAYAIAEQYKMLHDDRGMPTLQDAIVLSTPSRVKLPRSLSEAHIYFQNFRVALHVLMGSTHTLTQAYDAFWRRWSTSQQHLLGVRTAQPSLFPTLAVRCVQLLRISLWFAQQAMENAALEAPNFIELLNQIQLHMPWEPTFPSHFYDTRSIAPQSPAANLMTTTATTIAPIVAPTVGLTPPATTPEPAATIRGRGAMERKAQPVNPKFQKFLDMNLRVRDVLQRAGTTNRVPKNSAGVEMCLSYHMKGACNVNCARSGDHKEHTPAEDQAIVRWCETNYKPAE